MISDNDRVEMAQRAQRWLKADGLDGPRVARENALNEEHMALDVLELRGEVERIKAAALASSTEDLALVTKALDRWQAGMDETRPMVEKLAAIAERAIEQRDEVQRQLGCEREHSTFLSNANGRLFGEKAEVEAFCAKVRGEYTAQKAENDRVMGLLGEAMRDREAARDAAQRLIAQIDHLGAFADDGDPRVMAVAAPLSEAHADLWHALGLDFAVEAKRLLEDIQNRCAVCGWPLADSVEKGCVRGNCSYRPRPERLYAPERAAKEAEEAICG